MKNNKNNIFILVVALVIIIGVIYIYNSEKEIDSTKKEIKIGATLALTGPLAFIGEAEQRGLEMAVEDINLSGGIDGRKVVLISENNEGDVGMAVTNIKKLISADNVDVIFSAFTHVTQGVAGIIEEAKKPMIYASSIASIAESNELFFRDYFDAVNLGSVLGNRIIESDNKRFAYLGENNDACEPYIEEIKKILSKTDASVVIEDRFLPDSVDFRTSLTKIKSEDVDGIITCTWRKSDVFMKQLKELGMMDIDTYQTVAPFLPNADTPEMRMLYEENGTVSTWYGFSEGSLDKRQKEFSDRFEEKYGVKANSDAAFAYDDMMLMSKNMEKCFSDKGLDNKCFSEKMINSTYDGISGTLSFDRNGVSQRNGILIEVKNGEWVLSN